MRNSGKQNRNEEPKRSDTKFEHSDDVDALFRLPLAEFTGARNTLAARLKKSGRGDDAVLVKALGKPSISAWAVNQLYWNHREAFDQLIASGERFHKAQTSGKVADMRAALDARREALTHLSDLATSLLRDAGHNPAPDTIHRITTTLEALSVYASRSDAQRSGGPGRLTHDVDPPGFESLASFGQERQDAGGGRQAARTTGSETPKPTRLTHSQKPSSAATAERRKVAPDDDVRQLEQTRKATIAAAKVSLQDAKRSLTEARARAQSLGATQRKADAEAQKAEKHKRDAEESLEKAKAASENASRRVRSVTAEVEEAESEVKDAERAVEELSKELESLSRESSRRGRR